jgi:hypothetical protein
MGEYIGISVYNKPPVTEQNNLGINQDITFVESNDTQNIQSLDDLPVISKITTSWPLQKKEIYTDQIGEYYYILRSDEYGNPILDADGDEVLGRVYTKNYEKKDSTITR